MGKFRFALPFLGLMLCAGITAAQEKDYTKPIVDRSVKALGGAKKQALKGITCATKTKITPNENIQIELSASWSISGFDKYRGELNVQGPNGLTKSATLVINGTKIWAKDQDKNKTEEAPKEAQAIILADFRAMRFAQRPGLLRDKSLKLSPLGEMKIDGKDAVGIKVKQKGLPDIDIYFDKKTGLPLRSSVYGKDSKNGQEATHSFTFSDFKTIDGVKHFTRIVIRRDDTRVAEMRLSDIQLQENIDADRFKKP